MTYNVLNLTHSLTDSSTRRRRRWSIATSLRSGTPSGRRVHRVQGRGRSVHRRSSLVRRRIPRQPAGVRRLDQTEDASFVRLLPGRSRRRRLPVPAASSRLRDAERLGLSDVERARHLRGVSRLLPGSAVPQPAARPRIHRRTVGQR